MREWRAVFALGVPVSGNGEPWLPGRPDRRRPWSGFFLSLQRRALLPSLDVCARRANRTLPFFQQARAFRLPE